MSKCELTIKTIYFFAPIRPAPIPTTLSQRSFGEIIIIRIINLVYTFAPCDQTFDPGVSRSGNFLEAEERYRKEERRGERKKEEGKNEERWWQSTAKKIQGESFVDDLIWSRQNVGNWNAAGGGGRKKRGKIWLALEEFRWPVSWPIPRESFLGELGEEGVG